MRHPHCQCSRIPRLHNVCDATSAPWAQEPHKQSPRTLLLPATYKQLLWERRPRDWAQDNQEVISQTLPARPGVNVLMKEMLNDLRILTSLPRPPTEEVKDSSRSSANRDTFSLGVTDTRPLFLEKRIGTPAQEPAPKMPSPENRTHQDGTD